MDKTINHDYEFHERVAFEEEEGNEAYYSCSKCGKYFDEQRSFIEEIPLLSPKRSIILPTKHRGKEIEVIDPVVSSYLAKSEESEIASYLYSNQEYLNAKTSGVLLSWENVGEGTSFTVEIAKDEDFSNLERSIKNLTQNSTSVYNLLPGEHYYRVKDNKNNSSLVDGFVIPEGLRTIHSDSDGVRNIRDLAGWETMTGDKLKYGLLYRSALPSSTDLNVFYWDLGIKTELDLRIRGGQNDEIKTFKGVGDGLINYVTPVPQDAQFWPQYDQIFEPQYKENAKEYFTNVFMTMSKEENYPLVFHCKSGADRTGTLAYIINGLVGVSFEDLTKDYELTSFYRSARWRSDIEKDGQKYSFTLDGCMKETGRWNLFHKLMKEKYGESKTLPEAILSYLIDYLEIDSSLIQETLSIIVDGNEYQKLFKKENLV